MSGQDTTTTPHVDPLIEYVLSLEKSHGFDVGVGILSGNEAMR